MNGRRGRKIVENEDRILTPRQIKAVLEFYAPDPVEYRETVREVERIEREVKRELRGGELT